MFIYCLITCECSGQIYYTMGNHCCSIITFSWYLCKS